VGRVLDHLFNVGTQKIFSALSVSALHRFELSTDHVHFDTTSVSLYGDYRGADGDGAPFKITQGYSKDKRPDLKQFVLSLLCVEGMCRSWASSRMAMLRTRRSTIVS
jgi:transposase